MIEETIRRDGEKDLSARTLVIAVGNALMGDDGAGRAVIRTLEQLGLPEDVDVVDAGTAITVDFVDGEGTFHGGAIAPGS